MMNLPANDPARAYVRFYETMTAESLDRLPEVAAPDIRFLDPFNDVTGLAAMRRILEKMFAELGNPRFVVTHCAWAGPTCLLRWRFTAMSRNDGAEWVIVGMSELEFAPDGRVRSHIDHWDAARQVYEKVPVLGALIRFIRRRLAAG